MITPERIFHHWHLSDLIATLVSSMAAIEAEDRACERDDHTSSTIDQRQQERRLIEGTLNLLRQEYGNEQVDSIMDGLKPAALMDEENNPLMGGHEYEIVGLTPDSPLHGQRFYFGSNGKLFDSADPSKDPYTIKQSDVAGIRQISTAINWSYVFN